MKGPIGLIIFSIILFIFFMLPVYYLLTGVNLIPTNEPVSTTLRSSTVVSIVTVTLILGFGSSIIATVIGFLYAWLVYRTDLPAKSVFESLPLLALTIPLLLKVFAWIFLLSPQIGLFNLLFMAAGSPVPIFDIFTLGGMLLTNSTDVIPLAFLIVGAAVRSMDPSLEEASRTTGASMRQSLRSVTLPILLPAILSAFLLISMLSMNFVEVPLILGKGYVETLSTAIYAFAATSLPPRYDLAAQVGMGNILLTFSIFAAYVYLTRRGFRYVTVTGRPSAATSHPLGGWKWPSLLFCVAILFLVFVLPLSILVLMSFITSGNILSPGFGISNYLFALRLPGFFEAIENSILLAVGVGLGSTVLAVILAYAALKTNRRGSKLVELIGNVPMAIPGIVYSFALFLTFIFTPGLNIFYGTFVPMLIVLVFLYLPTALRVVSSNLVQVSDELEEASRVAGARWLVTFRKITVPSLLTGLLNSFYRGFLDSIRDLGPVILLSTPSSLLIVVLLFTLYASYAAGLNIVAAGSVMVTVIMAILLIAFRLIQRRVGPRGRMH